MKIRNTVFVAVVTLGCLGGYFYWAASGIREGIDPENDYTNWSPNAAALQKALPAGTKQEREAAFRTMFEKRFRAHEPGKAVGMRFRDDGKLSLLTPARLEPWHINTMAMMLHREALQDFGKDYDIVIYETFIGTAKIQIGEMKHSPNPKTPLQIVYRYPKTELVYLRPAVDTKSPTPRPASVMGYPNGMQNRPFVLPRGTKVKPVF